jgi:hypothetical protein
MSSRVPATLGRKAGKLVRHRLARIFPGRLGNWPNFLGIGVPKAGTTSLANCLAQHPEVSFPHSGKELHFFDYPRSETAVGRSLYRAEFPPNRAMGEFTPNYLYVRECRDRIRALLGPGIKFIVALRNPADRAYSHYCHAVRNWGNPRWQRLGYPRETLDFEEALALEPQRLASGEYHIRHQSYFSAGLYAAQIKWYQQVFPPEQFYIYLLEDFTSEPARILKELCVFLDIDPDHEFPDAGTRLNAQTRGSMSADTRKLLTGRYLADIKELERLIGRDLSAWYKAS